MGSLGRVTRAAAAGTLVAEQADALAELTSAVDRRTAAVAELEDAEAAVGHEVRRARRLGVGWEEIADRIGVSRQAVAKKYCNG